MYEVFKGLLPNPIDQKNHERSEFLIHRFVDSFTKKSDLSTDYLELEFSYIQVRVELRLIKYCSSC